METIGDILKEKRLELDYTLDDMSVKTKLSKIQLKAIEEGNISFFKDDLSYLTYFVRYYANALGIDYDEIRRDLDETISGYTNTLSISRMKDLERIDQSVAQRKVSTQKKKASIHKKDLASIGMIVLALAILIGLGFVFVKVIIPAFQSDPKDIVARPIPPNIDNGEGTGDGNGEGTGQQPEEKPEETPEEPANFTVSKAADLENTYDIIGWKDTDDVLFEVNVKVSTTLRFTLDGAVQTTPEPGVVYNAGDLIPLTTKAMKDKVLEISLGFPLNNEIAINGELIELDASVTSSRTAKTVTFRFIGE